jgi:hypothetical protein
MAGLLFKWLRSAAPDCSVPSYTRVDVSEGAAFSDDTASLIANALIDARVPPIVIEKLRERMTKEKYSLLLSAIADPERTLTRRGDFGEIIAACCMEQLMGYQIPVKKLRYAKMRRDDQPKGLDFLALKCDPTGRRLAEVCYVESKLRTGSDKTYAVEAHDQLRKLWSVTAPECHSFILTVLADRDDPLLDDFVDFMAGLTSCPATFCISVHADSDTWNDETLTNLKDLPPSLKPLTVVLCRVKNLKQRITDAFQLIGFVEADDDD